MSVLFFISRNVYVLKYNLYICHALTKIKELLKNYRLEGYTGNARVLANLPCNHCLIS